MDTAAVTTIITHMNGRSFYDILKALFHNHFAELPPSSWRVEVNGEDIGRTVMTHRLVYDDVLGLAHETWAWVQAGQAHVLHLEGFRDGRLSSVVDGAEMAETTLGLETSDEGQEGRVFLGMDVKGKSDSKEATYKFAGLIE